MGLVGWIVCSPSTLAAACLFALARAGFFGSRAGRQFTLYSTGIRGCSVAGQRGAKSPVNKRAFTLRAMLGFIFREVPFLQAHYAEVFTTR